MLILDQMRWLTLQYSCYPWGSAILDLFVLSHFIAG